MFTKAYIRHNPGTDDSYLGLYPHILFHLYIILNISIFAYGKMWVLFIFVIIVLYPHSC
jgi:hypothetical protein